MCLLLRLECDEPIALADASAVHDDLGALHGAIGAEDTGQVSLGGIATKIIKDYISILFEKLDKVRSRTHLIPPTKIRLGMSVPYLGPASGASSAPAGAAAGGGAAAILCISGGVVSRRKLAAPKGRILRLLLGSGVRAGRILIITRCRSSLARPASKLSRWLDCF